MYHSDFLRVARQAGASAAIDDDAMSRMAPQTLDFAKAVDLAGLGAHDTDLRGMMDDDGIVDWRRFDITRFASLMPSLATLDRVDDPSAPDFVYRYVGESINAMAKRNLRGVRLSDVLTGGGRDAILAAYRETVAQGRPHAGAGTVEVSDLTWVHYLRFLYPVRRDRDIDRVLLIMLFSTSGE